MSEVRPVPFAPGYFVSDDGRVFSERRGGLRERRLGNCGKYQSVMLYVGGTGVQMLVHRLVCTVFNGQQPSGCEVRHLDGDARNNRATNLAWGTRRENMADKRLHGTAQIGARNPLAKLKEEDVADIKIMLSLGVKQTHIGEMYDVRQANISAIANGETWAHVHGPDMTDRVRRHGQTHVAAKLTDGDVMLIRARFASGESMRSIAAAFGVSPQNISFVVRRKTWGHLPEAA